MARVGPALRLVAGRAEDWAVLFPARRAYARANAAKRLRTWLRRAVALDCWVLADVSVLEHNGQQFCLNLQLCQRF